MSANTVALPLEEYIREIALIMLILGNVSTVGILFDQTVMLRIVHYIERKRCALSAEVRMDNIRKIAHSLNHLEHAQSVVVAVGIIEKSALNLNQESDPRLSAQNVVE